MRVIFVIISLFCAIDSRADKLSAFGGDFPTDRLLSLLSNRDVVWDRNFAGVEPLISSNAKEVLKRMDTSTAREVRTWICDPERAVIAHVLLTIHQKKAYSISSSSWNGLGFISDDGEPCPKGEIERLIKHWNLAISYSDIVSGTSSLESTDWFSDFLEEVERPNSLELEVNESTSHWDESESLLLTGVQEGSRSRLQRALTALNKGRNEFTNLTPAPITVLEYGEDSFPDETGIRSASIVSIPESIPELERMKRKGLVEAELRRRDEYAKLNPKEFENADHFSKPVAIRRATLCGQDGWAIGCRWGLRSAGKRTVLLSHWSIYFVEDTEGKIIAFASCD